MPDPLFQESAKSLFPEPQKPAVGALFAEPNTTRNESDKKPVMASPLFADAPEVAPVTPAPSTSKPAPLFEEAPRGQLFPAAPAAASHPDSIPDKPAPAFSPEPLKAPPPSPAPAAHPALPAEELRAPPASKPAAVLPTTKLSAPPPVSAPVSAPDPRPMWENPEVARLMQFLPADLPASRKRVAENTLRSMLPVTMDSARLFAAEELEKVPMLVEELRRESETVGNLQVGDYLQRAQSFGSPAGGLLSALKKHLIHENPREEGLLLRARIQPSLNRARALAEMLERLQEQLLGLLAAGEAVVQHSANTTEMTELRERVSRLQGACQLILVSAKGAAQMVTQLDRDAKALEEFLQVTLPALELAHGIQR